MGNKMRKIGAWLKGSWAIIFALIFWGILSTCFFICLLQDLKIDAKIEAWAIITLVGVTAYYAMYTKRLAKEQKKKNEVDFWERRLLNFYLPLKCTLYKIQALAEQNSIDYDFCMEILEELTEILSLRRYIITIDLDESINNFFDELETWLPLKGEVALKAWLNAASPLIDKIMPKVNKEVATIELKIINAYGLSEKELDRFRGYEKILEDEPTKKSQAK